MSGGDVRGEFLFNLRPAVYYEFCRVMDGLSAPDWTRFASEVLGDQTGVRLAERTEKPTDCVMNQWGNRNGRVGELLDLLERLELLRPRDIILGSGASESNAPPPRLAPPPQQATPPPVSLCLLSPPSKSPGTPPTMPTCALTTTDEGGGLLPAPPPSSLKSAPPKTPPVAASGDGGCSGGDGISGAGRVSGVMCWSYEEVERGTEGFSPALQVGEGGFGTVYRASLRNTDCAVKRLKKDCPLDWNHLKDSFHTEVDKLSRFRHPNIVDLLGFCEGQGSMCLIYSYMENLSLEDQLHNVCGALSWPQRVSAVKDAAAALQFLHSPPNGHTPVLHGDVKSSNILLDRHLVAKLADFGLARFVVRRPSGSCSSRTSMVGRTATVRGTLAYLPEEYLRNGELGTCVDVFSFGVVLLEVLTGRRALERDSQSRETFLKDLVEEIQDGASGSCEAAWKKQLDQRLAAGAAEPRGSMEMVALACKCLKKKRKKTTSRPPMIQVFQNLEDIHNMVGRRDSSPPETPRDPGDPGDPSSPDSSVEAVAEKLSRLGPLEDTFSCSVSAPHPLRASSSSSSSSSSSLRAPSSSLFAPSSQSGPCETDESRGFSQYYLHSRSSDLSGQGSRERCGPPAPGPAQEDLSTAASLRSSPRTSAPEDPGGQRGRDSRVRVGDGRTPELLSPLGLYAESPAAVRGPEESDDPDPLAARRPD